jgi:aryl-alcohol dehydrogenase-like predicted oxidoreductase
MINRRKLFGITIAGATLAMSPQLVSAQQLSGKLIERTIPSSGEKLPVIGLAFSNHPGCADQTALKEVVKTFTDNGGRYFDATLGNMASQQFHARAANELGVANKVFWSSPAFLPGQPPSMGAAGVKAQIDSVLARTKASRIDLAWVNAAGPAEILAALKEEKKAGRVRYIGALTIVEQAQAAQLEAVMRNEPIDFIGVGYDIGNRFVEETILPLAIEKKIAVVAMFPFGNNSGVSCGALSLNLFARVGNRPVPEWASEFDAKTWAQFFAKYVISHPAVTIARIGTTKPHHMLDNLAGGVGRLPNEATRKRMAALIDSLPKPVPPQRGSPPPGAAAAAAPGIAVATAILDRYVGQYKSPSGMLVIMRREGDKLIVKPGNNPEAPLNARSETRFQDPRGPTFEFQVDGQGKVTGAILEQNGPQGPTKLALERVP